MIREKFNVLLFLSNNNRLVHCEVLTQFLDSTDQVLRMQNTIDYKNSELQ
jgi:hypothetical protein